MKRWYLSKVLWANTIALAALAVQAATGFIIDPASQAAILAVINLILRAVTGEEIDWKGGEEDAEE